MATNFGNTIMEGGITPSVQVQQPVQDRTGEVLGKALTPVAGAVGSIFGSIVHGQQQSAKDSILNDFNTRLLDYADAMDQGVSRDQVMLNVRNLTRQYLNDHPALRDDINKLYATVTSSSGMANIISSGTVEDRTRETIAIRAGELGITEGQYRQNLVAQQRLLELNNQWNALQAEGGIIDEQMIAEGREASRNYIVSLYPMAQSRIAEAMRQAEANPAEKAQIMNDVILSLQSEITQAESLAGMFDADDILNPIRNLLGVAQDWASGSIETSILEGQINNVTARANAALRLDPEVAETLARVKIFSDAGLPEPLMESLNVAKNLKTLVDVVRPIGDEPPIAVNGSTKSTEQVALVNELVMSSSSMSDEAKEEAYRSLNNLIEGLYVGERTITDPVSLKNIVETLGSEEARNLLDEFGGIQTSAANGAALVIENHYNRVLIPAINDAWFDEQAFRIEPTADGAIVYDFNNPPEANFYSPSQIADPIWNGSGVMFVTKPEFSDNPDIVSAVETLNTGNNPIAVPLNNTINAMANLSGVDPKTIWEQNMQNRLFGIGEQTTADRVNQTLDATPAETTTTPALEAVEPFNEQSALDGINEVIGQGDSQATVEALSYLPSGQNLTMDMFQGDMDGVLEVIEAAGAAEPQLMANATSPIEVAAGYLGLSESRDQDNITLSRFIRQAAGIEINPAKTAWCAAFVDAVLHKSNLGGGTGKLNARSYLNWGVPVDTPRRGDVVVFSRGDPNGWQGHVGFFEGYDSNGNIRVLGGNQGNQVSVTSYSPDRLLGFRRAG